MEQHLRILMVDDHPMIIEGYQMTLVATKKSHQHLDIDIAHDCDMANELIIKGANSDRPYDVLFFDISLPASKDGSITSGEDLAKIARTYLPDAKVIILTKSPYFSPNNIIAPASFASSIGRLLCSSNLIFSLIF